MDGEWASDDSDGPAGPVRGGQVVGPAAVILDNGPPFAVASIGVTREAGLIVARLEAVRRKPFELHVLGEVEAAHLTGFDPAGEEVLVLTDRGPMRVRGLRRPDAEWLSDTGLWDLPGDQLETLARALHIAESRGNGRWAAFDVADIKPVEFLHAHVCAHTGGVFALSYFTGVDERQPAPVAWRRGHRHGGKWETEPPMDCDRWVREGPKEGGAVRKYRISTAMAARFVEAFDAGQWISEAAALVAEDWDVENFTVHEVAPGLAARLAVLLRGATEAEIEGDPLLAFADGRGALGGGLLLDLLLSVDVATVAPLPADHPWARNGDVEVLLAVWNMSSRRLAALVAVAIPASKGGIVRAEVFPDFNRQGLRVLGIERADDAPSDSDVTEVRRRELSQWCAKSIAEQWPRLAAGTGDSSVMCERFADLPVEALHGLLHTPFSLTIYWTFLLPMLIDYQDYVREGRREWPTQREWSELAGRLKALSDDSAPDEDEEPLPFGTGRTL